MEPFLSGAREQIDVYLGAVLPPASEPPVRLHAAMRYAGFGGGKRLRPALAFAAARACEAEPERVLPVAGAAELIHAYSLVHDDLPAMDDDVERRGRPTVHVRYSEATAILVGDALQACAFGLLAGAGVEAELIAMLAHAAGSEGLVGGQEDDLGFRSEPVTLERVTSIHRRKTAALFGFSVLGAARLVGAPDERLRLLGTFAEEYGLAFQLLDDLGETRAKLLRVGRERVALGSAANRQHEFLVVDGLGEVVTRPQPQGFEHCLLVAGTGQDEYPQRRALLAQVAQHVDAVHPGQADVENQDSDAGVVREPDRLGPVFGGHAIEAGGFQDLADSFAEEQLVVYDSNPDPHASPPRPPCGLQDVLRNVRVLH